MRTGRSITFMAALALAGCQQACPVPGFTGYTKQCSGTQAGALPRPDDGAAQCTRINELRRQCAEQFLQGGAADILFVIDNSGSMDTEIKGIRENINDFATKISSSGLDFFIGVISEQGTGLNEICVPEPLAGPGCGNNLPVFQHVDELVDSTNGPEVLLDMFPLLLGQTRANASHHVIFVTDDNSAMSANAFRAQAAGAGQTFLTGATYHGIIGLSQQECPDIASVGQVYIDLASATGGMVIPICCDNYGQLLDALATGIAANTLRFPLEHQAIPDTVKVFTQPNASAPRVEVATGWSYDEGDNAVIFGTDARPDSGAIISVEYLAE